MIEIIPSARRLIRSLRDVGYEFVDAVADIVDNSIEAQANHISINFNGNVNVVSSSKNKLFSEISNLCSLQHNTFIKY
mgnify:CR=1 FL=1